MIAACASQAPAAVATPEPAAPVLVGEVPATELVGINYLPRCLALDANHLYWTRSSDRDGNVWRMPKSGGDAEKLADVPYAGSCALLGDELWVAGGGVTVAVPITGGPPRQVATISGELARGPDGMYIANPVTGLYRIAPSGTTTQLTVRPVVSIVGGDVIVFATEPDYVSDHEYRLWRLDDGVPVEVARPADRPWRLARSGDTVLISGPGADNGNALHSVPLAGGTPQLVAKHGSGSSEMLVDDRHIWWAGGDGVNRLLRSTGAVTLYAVDLPGRNSRADRHGLVGDTDAVYWLSIDLRGWASSTHSGIMRAARR